MLSLRNAAALIAVNASLIAGCADPSVDDGESSESELNGNAAQAGLYEGSPQAQGVLAVANDRGLSADDYVFRARISRATAEAIILTRNGTNGVMESRPAYGYGYGYGYAVDGGYGGSSSSGSVGYPYPYPYPTPGAWQLGGDDESFTSVRELDALPGTDIAAFKNLLSFAQSNGYISSSGADGGPWPSYDAGPYPWKDGGTWTDAGVKRDASTPPTDASVPWPVPDAGGD